jgi:hypothetical protein
MLYKLSNIEIPLGERDALLRLAVSLVILLIQPGI